MPAVIAGRGPQREQPGWPARAKVPTTVIESPSQDRFGSFTPPPHWSSDERGLRSDPASTVCGTPVPALNAGGASEIVVDGETGALVDGGDVRPYNDALPRALGATVARCCRRAEEFRAEEFARRCACARADATG